MSDWGSRNRDREVVVTGAGVLCHFGDDLQTIETMLREGRNTPFTIYPAGVATKSRCQLAGQYQGGLGDDDVGVTKSQGRFMGRQSRLALGASSGMNERRPSWKCPSRSRMHRISRWPWLDTAWLRCFARVTPF